MRTRGTLVIVHRQLTDVGRHRDGQSASRIVVAEEHIGNGCATFLTWIVSSEQGVSVPGSPSLVERTAFDVDYHEWLARFLQFLQQKFLIAQQRERGTVETFAAIHIGECLGIGHGSTCFFVTCLEVAGTRTTHHRYDDIGRASSCYSLSNIVLRRVTNSATLHIESGERRVERGELPRADGFENGLDIVIILGSRVVAQLVVLIVCIRSDNENLLRSVPGEG